MRNLLALAKSAIDHKFNEKLTRHQLEVRQLKKFRKLVAFVNERSPFYARIIEKNQIDIESCTPQDFPKITKTDLIKNFDDIITDPRVTQKEILAFLSSSKNPGDLFKDRFYVVHTSGSSGEIGYFVYAQHEWFKGLSNLLRFQPSNLKKRIAFIGPTGGHYTGVSIAISSQTLFSKRLLDSRVFDVSDSLQAIIDQLNQLQPHILITYPSILRLLAEQTRSGNLRIKPKLIKTSGEALLPGDRAFIEHTFQSPLVNIYISSENLIMGSGHPQQEGLLLFEDDLMFELEDDHVCVTNLYNYTMPLIRYTVADKLVPEPLTKQPYPYRTIKEVLGRSEQDLRLAARDGEDVISHHILTEFFVQNLERFQIKKTSNSSFIFRMQASPHLDNLQKKKLFKDIQYELNQILNKKLMANVQFSIEEVDSFSVNEKSGKFQLVVV
ncbi:phenylacetate--CoA ligase family protein [Oculatella sp. LEGE 06141]|uniref:phenylacetate--CoA ligase family protein n=1 Tax=Oculatella sp. LEGE 06141 TaxID=1828648 RepID=UPI00187E5176|nr:phenylacetate--CoA ligase family protein [Oculatella sp. LEGE 06141]MBE9182691.1 phenylacetate--CoA ligase family protein [Oculatella sp. LEGE 06141]